MSKLTLTNILSGYQTATAENANNAAIAAALENTLSRDGTAPNAMGAELDMNSHKVINVAAPTTANDAARLVDVQNAIAGVSEANLIHFTPYANIASTSVQGAIQEETDDLAASSGSSLVGFIQAGTGAVARTVQDKNRDVASVADFAAVGDGVADDTAEIQAASNAHSVVEVQPKTYKVTTLTLGANKTLVGTGFVSQIAGKIVAGARTVLSKLKIAPVSGQAVNMALTSDGVTLSDSQVVSTNDYAVVLNLDGSTDITVARCEVSANGFGVLTNNGGLTTPAASARVRVQDSYITSVTADAIELNHPSATVTGSITTGNFLANTAASGSATAGFSYGNAATEQWLFNNNVILDSRLEAIHIEDSQATGTVVGNSVRGRAVGLLAYPELVTGAGDAFPIVANSFKYTGAGVYEGIYINYASPVSPINGIPIVGNVVNGYTRGIRLMPSLTSVPQIYLADNNHTYNCTYSLMLTGGNGAKLRQYGTTYAHGSTTLCRVSGGTVTGGKFYADSKPTDILLNASGYSGFMPSSVDGFGYPIASYSTGAGSPTSVDLFPAGADQRFVGRLRFDGRRSGLPDWIYYTADVHWDGTTLTVTNILTRNGVSGAGAFTIPSFNVSGGNCRFTVTTTNATQLTYNWVEFDGEYWDA